MVNGDRIHTAAGPISPAALGTTLIHEHIFVKTTEIEATGFDRYWDEEAQVEIARVKLSELKSAGIDTLVDCTVPGLGRDIHAVARLAEIADTNILVATGLYSVGRLQFYFAFRGPGTARGGVDPIDALIKREIENGIDGTGIHPAFIKVALETPDPNAPLARPLASAARVHSDTGLPIQVHTDVTAETGCNALKILNTYGADLSRVVLTHTGDSNDLDYILRLADSGAFIGFDRFGLDIFNSSNDKIKNLVTLIKRGYTDQLVLSHDAHSFNDANPYPDDYGPPLFPDHRWTYIPDVIVPRLRDHDVSEQTIETILKNNPARFFTGKDL